MRLSALDTAVVVMDNQFYGIATLTLAPQGSLTRVNGLTISNNIFNASPEPLGHPSIGIDTSNGHIDPNQITDVRIVNNGNVLGTRATARAEWNGSLPTVGQGGEV